MRFFLKDKERDAVILAIMFVRTLKLTVAALLASGLFLSTSCTTPNPYTGEAQRAKATTGAAVGAALGGVIGALTGDDANDRRQRALKGAALGGLAGGGIGAYMDKQEAELRRELSGAGVGIQRTGNGIQLVMPGDITFRTGSAQIDGQFYRTLDAVGTVLRKYNQTAVAVTGHTDNVGGRSYNMGLSQARAGSVANYLQSRGVAGQRLQVSGLGYEQPIASNATAEGRQANRRVTINLTPYQQ